MLLAAILKRGFKKRMNATNSQTNLKKEQNSVNLQPKLKFILQAI